MRSGVIRSPLALDKSATTVLKVYCVEHFATGPEVDCVTLFQPCVMELLTPLCHTLSPVHPQVSGNSKAALSSTAAQTTDPFGIRIAFRPGHPLSLLTWGQYLAVVSRMSRTVEQRLQRHDLEALAAFNNDRRQLVRSLVQSVLCSNTGCQLPVALWFWIGCCGNG